MKDHYSHAATILPVNDVKKSMNYYRDVLGFDITFEWGDPVDYAVLRAGAVSLHLSKRSDNRSPNEHHIAIMIFVERIDQLYEVVKSKSATIKNEIGDREYHMRDFDIVDPDGYIISFGQGISH